MIPIEVIGLTCEAREHPSLQVGNLITGLLARQGGTGGEAVLSMTFFVNAPDQPAYQEAKNMVLAGVRDAFPRGLPPVSVVAQPPEGGMNVALEATVLGAITDEVTISRLAVDGTPYTRVVGFGARQVHGAGIASDDAGSDTARQAEAAFGKMEAILDREGLTYGQVVRQWNYLTDMLAVRGDCQVYQAFNDVRTLAYGKSEFPTGYPAATGIGQQAGGIVLEFIAIQAPEETRIEARSNPAQIDAHRYSEGVLVGAPIEEIDDKSSPKFERAKVVARGTEEVVFVSGTASIIGEESIAAFDVRAQTVTTLENIAALVDGERPSHLRAYVKNAEDIPVVREVCKSIYAGVPVLYVQADVCRDELLVEIEGIRISR